MSQRASGWERRPNELYETPEWCTEEVIRHLPKGITRVWECACGGGQMSKVLRRHGFEVTGTDAQNGEDFLNFLSAEGIDLIFTNPPYNKAQEFIEHALKLMQPNKGAVAMLLRIDYDSAKTRAHLFETHPAWWKKLVFRKRIVWFQGEKSPSFNHAVYIWNWQHDGSPATIAYGP
jgi:hypothetical protein